MYSKPLLISILKYIPYSYTEDLAIELLKNENNMTNKTFIAGVLCDIFSLRGMEHGLKIVEEKDYDVQAMHLLDYITPVYTYYNEKIDNLADIELKDDKFIQEEMENDPLYLLIMIAVAILVGGNVLGFSASKLEQSVAPWPV